MDHFKIGIDVRMWEHPGIGRYIRELSKEFVIEPFEYPIVFLGSAGFKEQFLSTNGRLGFREAHSKIYTLGEQVEILKKAGDLDLLHVPHFNIPVLFNKKLVVTIHDLIYLREPRASKSPFGGAYVSWLLKVIERKASAIIAVSEHTKNDILDYCPGMDAERVFVTPEAVSPSFQKMEEGELLKRAKDKHLLKNPFVLYVGSLKAHKNIPTLIKAMKQLRERKGLAHELVLVGRKDSRNKELLDLISKESFVRYLGELSDQDIVCLYNLADLFVLPSYWEGFGLPVLEAMACGTPVAASNSSSLPEVVGEAGLLFDPHQVDALSGVIYNVLTDNKLREKMSEMGLEQVKKFSWKKTAMETLRIYRQVLA